MCVNVLKQHQLYLAMQDNLTKFIKFELQVSACDFMDAIKYQGYITKCFPYRETSSFIYNTYIQFNSRGIQYNELIICDYSGKGQYNPEIFDAILLNTSNNQVYIPALIIK